MLLTELSTALWHCLCSLSDVNPHVLLLCCLQAQRAALEQIQQLEQSVEHAQQQLAAAAAATEQQVAAVRAAAAQEVDVHRQKWREEFQKRRKLHNTVGTLRQSTKLVPATYRGHPFCVPLAPAPRMLHSC